MNLFRNISIRTKLILLTAISISVALSLAAGAFLMINYSMIRSSRINQLDSLTDVLAANVSAALDFNDVETAQELLSSLQSQPEVKSACLYDASGKLFTCFPETASAEAPQQGSPFPENEYFFAANGDLNLSKRIEADSEFVGHITLRAATQDINGMMVQYVWIISIVMLVSLAISIVLAGRLQESFTKPILKLAQIMGEISAEEDYSKRMQQDSSDEFGAVCSGFNSLLDQVEDANRKLQSAHDGLEKLVSKRTSELEEAKNAAEAANHSKSEFLANMSHEIRTPMTAILGYTDLLYDYDAEEQDRKEYIKTIQRNGDHLLQIINDILDISKIEAGKIVIEKMVCSPRTLVAEVASLMRSRAIMKNISFQVEYQGHIPEMVETDPTRLRQILTNLVGNAIKFTEHGEVKLVVSMSEKTSESDSMLVLEVIDTGMGMSEEQLDVIFEPFSQADGSMNRRFGGTGLGLTISKRFADMLGGDITVTSTPGVGSRFAVSIYPGRLDDTRMLTECSEALQPVPTEIMAVDLEITQRDGQLRVLLVEDGPDNQRLIAFVLKKAGAQVMVAENGLIGLQKALQAEDDREPFDVVLMDMQMPVMDGYEATAKLRDAGYHRPIIALTAHAMAGDREKCLKAGCDEYLTKPINRKKLIRMLTLQLDRTTPEPAV